MRFLSLLLLAGAWASTAVATPERVVDCPWVFRVISGARMGDKIDELSDEGRLVEMGMFDAVRLESPQACRSGGLGPCIGLAVINRKTNVAYVAHLTGGPGDVEDYRGLLQTALKEAASPGDLQVVMAGAAIPRRFPPNVDRAATIKDMNAFCQGLRDQVAQLQIPPEQVTDKLRLVPDEKTYELVVDTAKRRIYLSGARD